MRNADYEGLLLHINVALYFAKLTNKSSKLLLIPTFSHASLSPSGLFSSSTSRSSMSILLTRYLGLVLLFSFVDAKTVRVQNRATSIDASSINGKFLFGYQGFFRRPGQGNDHWSINYGEITGPSNLGAGEFRFYFHFPLSLKFRQTSCYNTLLRL